MSARVAVVPATTDAGTIDGIIESGVVDSDTVDSDTADLGDNVSTPVDVATRAVDGDTVASVYARLRVTAVVMEASTNHADLMRSRHPPIGSRAQSHNPAQSLLQTCVLGLRAGPLSGGEPHRQ